MNAIPGQDDREHERKQWRAEEALARLKKVLAIADRTATIYGDMTLTITFEVGIVGPVVSGIVLAPAREP